MAGKTFLDVKDGDIVEYFLYPELPSSCDGDEIDLKFVTEIMETILEKAKKLSENYIWHCDDFRISYNNQLPGGHSNVNERQPFHFYGSLHYGENIEDEWFLVFILVELTKQVKGLIARVKDSDGEFLLIEAANHIPKWMSPETCDDKVFIYNGQLHILPKSFSKEENFTITENVIRFLKQHPEKTKASDMVQQDIHSQIKRYPEKMKEKFHRATAYVPVGVAALLNAEPKLISPAVRAFCERDMVDLNACRAMKFFPPENRVMTQVNFTKFLYAMLVSSKYVPDVRTGWNLPSTQEENYKSHILGVKLACGFEILMTQAKSKTKSANGIDEVDFSNDANWKIFLNSLSSKNYFKGLLQHSKEYNELLDAATEFYKNSCENLVKPNIAKEVSDVMDRIEVDVEDLRKKESDLCQSDDDSWMTVSEKDLDEMLEARFGPQKKDLENSNGNSDVAGHLNAFLNQLSGLEGVEFPKKETKTAPVRPKRGVKTKKRKTVKFSPDTKLHSSTSTDQVSQSKSNRVQFEPNGFIHAIQNILDFSIPDDNYWESDGSGMSSYEDENDMELGETAITNKPKDHDMIKYMDQMDEELENTTLSKSFVRKKDENVKKAQEDNFDDIESFKPVDIDLNALKNILSSYQAQMGEAGPAENLLAPLGINLDDIDADVD